MYSPFFPLLLTTVCIECWSMRLLQTLLLMVQEYNQRLTSNWHSICSEWHKVLQVTSILLYLLSCLWQPSYLYRIYSWSAYSNWSVFDIFITRWSYLLCCGFVYCSHNSRNWLAMKCVSEPHVLRDCISLLDFGSEIQMDLFLAITLGSMEWDLCPRWWMVD